MELSTKALANRIVVALIMALSVAIIGLLAMDLRKTNLHSIEGLFTGFFEDVKTTTIDIVDINSWVRPKDNSKAPTINSEVGLKLTAKTVTATPTQEAVAQAPPPAPKSTATVAAAPASPVSVPAPPDLYAWGNCTWWVAKRRAQVNEPIPNSWGNADTWAERASAQGYLIDHNPSPGAIMQIPWSDGGLGHVAFVENVNPDGSWRISEMNVIGLGRVDYRVEPAAVASQYNFIHT